jgi:hypothetical protein
MLKSLNPISTAEASPLSDYADRNRQALEGTMDEQVAPAPIPQQPQAQTTTIAPAKVKQFSDGVWKKWDDSKQGWVPLSPAELKKQVGAKSGQNITTAVVGVRD